MTTGQGQVELVLFDLGGVLVRLGDLSAMQGLVGPGSEEESWARWLACPWVKSLQRGQCQPEDFAVGVVSDLGLAITPAEFLELGPRQSVSCAAPRSPVRYSPSPHEGVNRCRRQRCSDENT